MIQNFRNDVSWALACLMNTLLCCCVLSPDLPLPFVILYDQPMEKRVYLKGDAAVKLRRFGAIMN
jgi:hypothetical protein